MKQLLPITLLCATLLVATPCAFSQINFSVDQNYGCAPLTVTFTNNSTSGDLFYWNFGQGPDYLAYDTIVTFTQPGYYYINLNAFDTTGNYLGNYSESIEVLGTDFTMSIGDGACPGEKISFDAFGDFDEVDWSFGDGQSGSEWHEEYQYPDPGTYYVTLFTTGLCGTDSITKIITVSNAAIPLVQIDYFDKNEFCPNDNILFTCSYDYPSYFWDFDDGGTSAMRKPSHKYSLLGEKVVTLTTTNICGNSNMDTLFLNITSNAYADAGFGYWSDASCPGEAYNFFSGDAGDFTWDFGNGGTSSQRNPNYIFADTGLFTVSLIVENSCGNSDTSSQEVHVKYNPGIVPQAFINFFAQDWDLDSITICPGEEVAFNNYSWSQGKVEFDWDFGDGGSSDHKDAVHIFETSGMFQIELIATNNCNGKDTAYKWVNVDPEALPVASLQAIPEIICPGETLYLFDDKSKFDDSGYTYSIWFGDGDSLINQTTYNHESLPVFYHIYPDTGSFDFSFSVTNQCGNSFSISNTLVVGNDPYQGSFYYSENSTSGSDVYNDHSSCPGDSVDFWVVGGISYEWNFGDGTISTDQFPSHVYADTGYFNAYVICTNGCGAVDTVESLVAVSDTNTADVWFDMESDVVCAFDTINFTYPNAHESRNRGFSYEWEFSDGTIMTGSTVSHAFINGGYHLVKLVITNSCGSDSTYRYINVASPIIDFSVSDTIVPPLTTINFLNQTTDAVSYSWDFGDGTTSNSPTPSHSYQNYGIYDVTLTATSGFGCTTSTTFDDFIFIHDMQVAQTIVKDIRCFGDQNGAIDIAITGGSSPYTYLWNDGSTIQDRSNLSKGSYWVKITDAEGLKVYKFFFITEPDNLYTLVEAGDATCNDEDDGEIDLTPGGGITPYSFLWSNGFTTEDLYLVPAETYTVTITDANGCTHKKSNISVDAPPPFDFYVSSTVLTSGCGNADASAWVIMNSPGVFSYEWDDDLSQTGDTAFGLSVGAYSVYVYDTSYCVDSATITISDPGGPGISFPGVQNVSCAGGNNGTISAQVYSGTPPFTFEWNTDPIQTTLQATGLTAGIYSIYAEDNNGCATVEIMTVSEPDALNIIFEKIDPKCFGSYNGSAVAHVSGGWNDYYYYQWSNGGQDSVIINRNANTYSVTVQDDYNCKSIRSVTLENPPQMTINGFISDVSFYGANDGIIDISIQNGEPPYSYNWSTGATIEDLGGLSAGTYSGTVVDSRGCTATSSGIVEGPQPLSISIESSGETDFCLGQSVTLSADSGYVSYLWSTGETTSEITAIETNTYSVTVTSEDSYGTASIDIAVSEPYAFQGLCLVTVDTSTSSNLIVWEKTDDSSIVSYTIYKESTSANQYNLIGTVPQDSLTIFTDSNSNPAQQSSRYKISVTDTCGNESELSEAHKTMHLTVSTGIGVYNLIWENYEGFDFGSYIIYRGTNMQNLVPITYIQSNLTSYTDFQPEGLFYYQVVVVKDDSCVLYTPAKTMSGPYSQSFSNLDDNGYAQEVVVADFTANATNVDKGSSLTFTDASTGNVTSWNWTFVGGSPSSFSGQTPPAILYDSLGTFDVSLSVSNGSGTSTETKTAYVYVSNPTNFGVGFIGSPRYFTSSPFIVSFDNLTTDPEKYSYVWIFGDDNTSTELNPIHTYQDTGYYTVTLIAQDTATSIQDTVTKTNYINCSDLSAIGELSSGSLELRIYPNPFSSKTTIEFSNPLHEKYNFSVIDLTGKKVFFREGISKESFEFDRQGLSNGFYRIELRGNELYRGKIIVVN